MCSIMHVDCRARRPGSCMLRRRMWKRKVTCLMAGVRSVSHSVGRDSPQNQCPFPSLKLQPNPLLPTCCCMLRLTVALKNIASCRRTNKAAPTSWLQAPIDAGTASSSHLTLQHTVVPPDDCSAFFVSFVCVSEHPCPPLTLPSPAYKHCSTSTTPSALPTKST